MNRYRVYYGNYTIYGTEQVQIKDSRGITIFDGLESGKFPVPDNKDLQEITIKCQLTEKNDYGLSGWEPAQSIILGLEKMLGSADPERLVITSSYDKLSIQALLKDFNRDEAFPGAWTVSIKLIEYKAAKKRTTGVPAIQRPGKIPSPPPVQVFPSASAVADNAMQQALMGDFKKLEYEWINEQGEAKHTDNPNLVPMDTAIRIGDSWVENLNKAGPLDQAGIIDLASHGEDKTKEVRAAVSKAYKEFEEGFVKGFNTKVHSKGEFGK